MTKKTRCFRNMRILTIYTYLLLTCAISFSTCTSRNCSKNNSGISTITGNEECCMEVRNPANDPNGPKKQIDIVGARDESLQSCLQDLNSTLLHINKAIVVKDSNFTIPKLVAELEKHTETLNTLTIYFETSHLLEIPRNGFGYFRKVRKITLAGNGIEKLVTESFLNLEKLITLNLSENDITIIPRQAFSQLPRLQRIDLSFNKIVSLCADAFYEIPNLNFVDLEENSMTAINLTVFQYTSLSEINLSYNNLTAINDDIKYIPDIEQLYLDHNQLTYLSQEISDLSKLEELKIDHNPWVCDCEHRQVIKMVIQLSIAGEVDCSIPANTSMQVFNESELFCVNSIIGQDPKQQEEESVTLVILAVGGGIVIFCVFTSLVCLWRRRRRNKLAMSPCGMVPNSNYSRLFSSSSTVSASSTTYVNKSMLKVGKLLGRGAFGEVYEGFSDDVEDGNKMVAIKMIRETSSLQDFEALEQEFKQLTQIDKHSYIIQVFSIGKIDDSYVMVMEMAEHGDLLTYLRKMYEREEHVISSLDSSEEKYYLLNDQPRLFSFMWNVAKGIEYLSRLKILHRDLAARNTLLCSGPVAKIADFGLSRDVYESGYYYQDSQGRLPYKWLSPEALINGKSTLKSDVWSFGILMWEVVTLGSNPYPGIPPSILIDMYRNLYIMPQPPLCPDDIYAIMQKCWDHCVDTRADFTRILEMLDSFIQTAPNMESLTVEKEVDESHHLISDIE